MGPSLSICTFSTWKIVMVEDQRYQGGLSMEPTRHASLSTTDNCECSCKVLVSRITTNLPKNYAYFLSDGLAKPDAPTGM